MTIYRAPLDDYAFLIEEVLGPGALVGLPGLEEATPDAIRAVLREGARFAENVLVPLNPIGDREGCALVDGRVRMPAGFREAYDAYARGGWVGIAMDPAYGGQGLPLVVNAAMQEILTSANMSFATIPGLSQAAYALIARLGDDATKRDVLPRLASGAWSGTMCLTEPESGSDLGLIRTRAEPAGDGSYRLTGEKIFISGGDHDLTKGIVHLVLARATGAPEGTAGLSLFLVPARDPATGEPNGVACTRLEEKMGLHASPTCALAFDGAVGRLLGEPGRGLSHMFVMMNAARLAVAAQGVAMAELAYQNATSYARERLQGRAPGRGTPPPGHAADPILAHPDVRRLLLSARVAAEGGRAVIAELSVALDRERRHPDPAERQAAGELVQLLTPVAKAHFTSAGTRSADRCLQVFGGHGYIRDTGVEQFLRDARIAEIYEGTNGIQALDLVARKLPQHGGRLLRCFFHPTRAFLDRAAASAEPPWWLESLERAYARLQRATAEIAGRGQIDPAGAAAIASDYLDLFALVVLGRAWAGMDRAAETALRHAADGRRRLFLEAKRASARFFYESVLPESVGPFARIMGGGRAITGFPDEAF